MKATAPLAQQHCSVAVRCGGGWKRLGPASAGPRSAPRQSVVAPARARRLGNVDRRRHGETHAVLENDVPEQEVAARGGKIILVTDPKGAKEATIDSVETLSLPDMASAVTPLVYAIPVQLIAYHTAAAIGTDVDQPRNLAKSVTVE